MNIDKLKEYIKIAKESVKDESEPYKTEGYKIILEKLLDTTDTKQSKHNKKIESKETDDSTLNVNIEKELANKCGLTLNEIKDVISINNKIIEIIAPISGTDSKKHIIVGLCVLAANEFILKEEWIESPKIAECLRSIGVRDISNLSFTLKRYPSLIRTVGGRGKHKKYKLTSNEGRAKAFEIIKKLAKGEEITV